MQTQSESSADARIRIKSPQIGAPRRVVQVRTTDVRSDAMRGDTGAPRSMPRSDAIRRDDRKSAFDQESRMPYMLHICD